jgi:LDH2 family malate/lactate/ureidoglycolate dehydrogenase
MPVRLLHQLTAKSACWAPIPICYAIPAGKEFALFILDMATSAAANGQNSKLLKEKNKTIAPKVWVEMQNGTKQPTTPKALKSRRVYLFAIGKATKTMAVIKVMDWGALVDILSGGFLSRC